jgi:hypothetical protein
VNRTNLERQYFVCKNIFDESTMYESKSKVYYNITQEAEESREKGFIPSYFGLGIVKIIDQLDCSEERKNAARYDLEHNYELRTLSCCEKCAPVASFMRIG